MLLRLANKVLDAARLEIEYWQLKLERRKAVSMSNEKIQIYVEALKLAQSYNQVRGRRGDYYITLEQLHDILHPEKAISSQAGAPEEKKP